MLSINYQIPSFTFKPKETTVTYLYTEESLTEIVDMESTEEDTTEIVVDKSTYKDRILTYFRNELLIVYVSEIAYIYKENSITYVVNMNGQKSVSNNSLDTLFAELDHHYFFRVNRQVILGVSAIKKIVKMGQGLKIETFPASENPIFVGKNKSLAFKNWLNS
ncbi:LytTR family transcriptional regulator DNA-binding domain-containing protein [uncultured Dokdonia sp.]|uniref:LytTR family transcriptional regulator DNA-binding domain-containing protein n=1 Tax=uncultured Dokdonia sp. TaxID=575653 RepID=UPI0026289495|nr:LytTR family transcriptional regulator DNA-binding domain-containing protein [uncultured Dokdonia sp.]